MSIQDIYFIIKRFTLYLYRFSLRNILVILPGTSLSWAPPRRYISSASNSIASTATYFPAYNSESFTRSPAHSIERRIPAVFDSARHEQIKAYGTFTFPMGRVVGAAPLVIDANDCVIGDLSFQFDPCHDRAYYKFQLPKPVYIKGRVLVLAGGSGNNYFHWLQQMLPRLVIAQKSNYNPYGYSAYIINNGPPFIAQSLESFNINIEACISIDNNTHIIAEELVVPEAPFAGNPSHWITDLYQDLSKNRSNNTKQFTNRLYVSRSRAKTRRIQNESQVLEILSSFGFITVFTEELTFEDQVDLFRSADIVFGPHGAGLSNIFFCRPGSTVIELFYPQHPNICFWTIASQCNLNYYYILGEGSVVDFADYSKPHLNHLDITCDPLKLNRLLQQLCP